MKIVEELINLAAEWISERPEKVAVSFEVVVAILALPAIVLMVCVGAAVYVCNLAAFLWDRLRFSNPD